MHVLSVVHAVCTSLSESEQYKINGALGMGNSWLVVYKLSTNDYSHTR